MVVAAALALTLVAGCGRNEGGQLPEVSGEAVQAKREEVKGFALVRAWPDQKGEELAIALEFSRPLVATQDFDALITFESTMGAKSSWQLDEGGKVLRFPFVRANTEYVLTLSAKLAAADGSVLGRDLVQKVYTGELKPAVGFASQGSVLPARDARGLPVVSVNVQEVDVEFLRVKDKALPKFFAEFRRPGMRDGWDLDAEYDERSPLHALADPVYVNRFILGGKPNERVVTYLPVQEIDELREPGLYFAVMRRPGRFSGSFDTTFFTVSDIGLHTRAYKDKLFVHTASLQDGEGIGSVSLQVLDAAGEVLMKGTTDRNGNALLNYTLDARHVLVARKGSDVSMLPFNQPALDLSEFAVAGRMNAWFDVFAWSGRDLYRPGETVRISALLRDNDGRLVAAKGGKPQPLFVRLVQPDGKPLLETRLEPGAQGYYRFERAIPTDAPTGQWSVQFRTDPASKEAVQGMTLRIEEFLPERMKLELEAPAVARLGQPFPLTAKGAYLYGAPAAGNRFTAKMTVAVDQRPFAQLPGWFFGDPSMKLPREAKEVIDATLDANGQLTQPITLPAEAKPLSPIKVIVTGSLFESGGRAINRSIERTLWPADVVVGVRPLFPHEDGTDVNARAGFELGRYGTDGKPRAGKGLKVTLVREHRDYHWAWQDEGGWDYSYTQRDEIMETRVVDVGTTAARIDVPVEWGGYRLEVFDPATKLTTRYPFNAGWGWDNENTGLDARPDKVKLALDKTGYRAGDTLRVTVTPPQPGRVLLMVESDRMLFVEEHEVERGDTFEIPVTKDWERHDVYITALVFRGGSAASVVTPSRAVGVAHVPMDRKARRVQVALTVPAQMRPEQTLPATVSAPALAGKEAYVTVSAVDVGILNITRFPVPDANRHFFAQRRLGVDAYDIYGRVIESFEGQAGRLRFGGDMALPPLAQARRPTARVQTVDLFSGPVRLDARGQATVALKVPDFNGALRVSALVYSAEQYGNVDKEVVVRAPIVAEASMPRVLAPGDRSSVTLDLTNFTGKPGTFAVRVEGIGPLGVDAGSRSAALAAGGKTTLTFPVVAREGYTVAQVRVRVDGNGVKVDRRYDLPVRPAWPGVIRTRAVSSDGGVLAMDASMAEGLMPGSVQAQMTVSALPPIPFVAALEDMLRYPYGCAEQTTSKGFAALVMDPRTAQLLGVPGLSVADRRMRMEGAFGRLASMQLSSGHFSMWGDDDYVNASLTPYIAEFLLDAKEAGFAVPEAVLQKALKRLSEDLLAGGVQFYGADHREHLKFSYQAHAGYVLARVNRAPLGTLRALFDNERKKSLTGLPLVHLGLALHLQGDKTRGQRAIALGFAFKGDRIGYLADYATPLRDLALMTALVRERGVSRPEYDGAMLALGRELDARRSERWMYLSTQEQVAIARLGRSLLADSKARVAGTWRVGSATEAVTDRRMTGRRADFDALASGLRFEPQGPGKVYASLEVAGVPRTAPAPDASVIGVERRWYTMDGKPWTPKPLAEGETLIVAVKITADRTMPDALLTELLPAGLELENLNLTDDRQWSEVVIEGITLSERTEASNVVHEEFRDDRYIAALRLGSGSPAHVFYLVRAVTPGTYTVPPPMVEDMYRPTLRGVGRATPATITVVQPR